MKHESIETIDTQDFNEDNEVQLQSIKDAQDYNKNIRVHKECYSSFRPLHDVLVRIYRRMPIVTEGNVVLDLPESIDYAKLTKIAGSGQEYSLQEVPTTFRFTTKAVIVSVPDHMVSKLSPGQEVTIHQLKTEAVKYEDGSIFYNYDGAFVHPYSNKAIIPSDCTDPDYGYALVPSSIIRGHNPIPDVR